MLFNDKEVKARIRHPRAERSSTRTVVEHILGLSTPPNPPPNYKHLRILKRFSRQGKLFRSQVAMKDASGTPSCGWQARAPSINGPIEKAVYVVDLLREKKKSPETKHLGQWEKKRTEYDDRLALPGLITSRAHSDGRVKLPSADSRWLSKQVAFTSVKEKFCSQTREATMTI